MSIAMQTSPTLLIIEDDPDNARSVDEAAQDAGFITHCAATGLAGVEAFEQQMPDLVLSDLVLPDIDGLQVLARLRKLDAAVPVIIMTAYGSVESGVRAMREGAYDYVTKPLDLDDIQSSCAVPTKPHACGVRSTSSRRPYVKNTPPPLSLPSPQRCRP